MPLTPSALRHAAVVSTDGGFVDTTRRKKHQIRLELDLNKQFDYDLTGHIYWLKHQRKFTPTLRDALRLIWDLQQGKTDVLHELFPFVAQHQLLNEERLAAAITAHLNAAPARAVGLSEDTDTVEVKAVADNGAAIETFLQSAAGLQGKPTAPKIKGISGAALTLSAPEEEDE